MIAIDTDLLVYAHRADAVQHRRSWRALDRAAASGSWGLSLASVAEFLAVVTHPGTAGGPSPPAQAHAFLNALAAGGAAVWHPGPGFGDRLAQMSIDLGVSGPRIFDLQIGLTAFEAGALELWTHDAAFVRLPGLRIVDPLR